MIEVTVTVPIKSVEELEKRLQMPFNEIKDWLYKYLVELHRNRFKRRISPGGKKWKRTSPQSILLRRTKTWITHPITLDSIRRLSRRGTTTLMDFMSLYYSLFTTHYHIWEVKGNLVRYGTRHPAAKAHQEGLMGTRISVEKMKERAWAKLGTNPEGQQEFWKLIRSCWFKRYAAKIPSRLPKREFIGLNRKDLGIVDKKLEETFKRRIKELFK
jgi:hypothetical protein